MSARKFEGGRLICKTARLCHVRDRGSSSPDPSLTGSTLQIRHAGESLLSEFSSIIVPNGASLH